ncbi:hypothetical protein [Candidatus Endomicrobiellum pyrsonymphae]|uniref:hypothetical protein n=1 Tax=Candidatus Endomicrobiellum pyrsonymphae TaxID=1408203 RepID=UPI0035A8823F
MANNYIISQHNAHFRNFKVCGLASCQIKFLIYNSTLKSGKDYGQKSGKKQTFLKQFHSEEVLTNGTILEL